MVLAQVLDNGSDAVRLFGVTLVGVSEIGRAHV